MAPFSAKPLSCARAILGRPHSMCGGVRRCPTGWLLALGSGLPSAGRSCESRYGRALPLSSPHSWAVLDNVCQAGCIVLNFPLAKRNHSLLHNGRLSGGDLAAGSWKRERQAPDGPGSYCRAPPGPGDCEFLAFWPKSSLVGWSIKVPGTSSLRASGLPCLV